MRLVHLQVSGGAYCRPGGIAHEEEDGGGRRHFFFNMYFVIFSFAHHFVLYSSCGE